MSTYQKYALNLTRHEGNRADIIIELDNLDMSEISLITFEVRDEDDILLIRKTSDDEDEISVDDQTFTIELYAEDTKGNAGSHFYEIDFVNVPDEEPFATIGGTFTITAEVNQT